MVAVATFNQIVGSETLRIAVPVTRITKIMDRVDILIEAGNTFKARQVLTPFIVNDKTVKKAVAKNVDKKTAALKIIADNTALDRAALIKKIQTDLSCTYANARYYVVNTAGK